jgi:hypothetical protein
VHCRPGLRPVGAGLLVEPGLFVFVRRTGLLLPELALMDGADRSSAAMTKRIAARQCVV